MRFNFLLTVLLLALFGEYQEVIGNYEVQWCFVNKNNERLLYLRMRKGVSGEETLIFNETH
jgi:hypothetical protein